MAKLRKQKNISVGSQSYKYRKTGAGALPSDPSTTPSGAALTLVANDEMALAGDNDQIDGFFRLYDPAADRISVWTPDSAGEVAAVPANGTITPGGFVVGYLDTDRGKVKEATLSSTPTVAELGAVAAARWVCKSSSAGSCNVVPR